MKRALVLSGGGVKGAYQVGALQYLFDQGYSYDYYCGISVGALNSAYLAMFSETERTKAIYGLYDLWKSIDNKAVWKHWKPVKYLPGLWKDSLLNQQPLIDLVYKKLNNW